jgi:hypothetical protein
MPNFWTYISNLGLKDTDTSRQVRKYQLINRICFLAALVTFIFVGHIYLIGHYYYVWIQLLTGFLVTVSWFLFSSRYRHYAAYYSMFSVILANVFYCSIEIPGAGVEYFLIPLGFGTLLVLESKKIHITLITLCAITLHISYFLKSTYTPSYTVAETALNITYFMTLSANFILCSLFVFQFKGLNEKYERVIKNRFGTQKQRNH